MQYHQDPTDVQYLVGQKQRHETVRKRYLTCRINKHSWPLECRDKMESKSLFKIKPEVSSKVYRPVKTQPLPLLAHFSGFCLLTKSSLTVFFQFPLLFPRRSISRTRGEPLDTSLFSTVLQIHFCVCSHGRKLILGFYCITAPVESVAHLGHLWQFHGSTQGEQSSPASGPAGIPTHLHLCKLTGPAGMKSQGHWDRHWGPELCCIPLVLK